VTLPISTNKNYCFVEEFLLKIRKRNLIVAIDFLIRFVKLCQGQIVISDSVISGILQLKVSDIKELKINILDQL